jgi:tRNA threonylcarbamoyladenosine biosynthesis protein TsaE
MGVGKTTLIKALSLCLGVKDIVNSPTFSIINEYVTYNDQKIYHFDFYRIEDEINLYDIGCEDYLLGPNYCFVEWPEKALGLIDNNFVKIYMQIIDGKRYIDVKF